IFQEQSNAGFVEAKGGVACVGGLGLPGYGDESSGIGARSSCDGRINHFRITFRYLNAVHVLYISGDLSYVYEDVALNLGRILDERVRAVPTYSGPPADQVWNLFPREICLSADDAGKEIDTATNRDGSDSGAPFCEVRFT